MSTRQSDSFDLVTQRLRQLITCESPDITIVIPVNAKGDLVKVLDLLADISLYEGSERLQIILVVNNYDPSEVPTEAIQHYEEMGAKTLAVPALGGNTGIPPGLRARMLALPHACTRACVFFDADCRLPNATACLDWYVKVLRQTDMMLAYTKIGYYNWPNHRLVMRLWLRVHYTWRAFKRVVMRVPTPQGASYAIDRKLKQQLFDDGYLADETGLGRLVQSFGHKSVYTGSKDCTVMADGRMYQNVSGFKLFTSYALRRLRINLASLIVRKDAAKHTGRQEDKEHEYDAQGRCVNDS